MSSLFAGVSSVFFPSATRDGLLAQSRLGRYPRKIVPFEFVYAFLDAFLRHIPSLRDIAERSGKRIGTSQISTISYALGSGLFIRLSRICLDALSWRSDLVSPSDIVVLDSMAASLPETVQHNCARMNNKTVGGGVLWGFCLTARRCIPPIRVLAVMRGAWHDGTVMKNVALIARGPLYIMDRGFYTIDLMVRWLAEGVRFLVRVRGRSFVYTPVETLGESGRLLRAKTSTRGPKRTARVFFDGTASIGGAQRRGNHPLVRLLIVEIRSAKKCEKVILASSELTAPAQELLDLYGRRWEIEEFHRVVKRSIGLAHLYSFRERGIEMLLCLAALVAMLLRLDGQGEEEGDNAAAEHGPTIPQLIRKILEKARRALGLSRQWRPNTVGKTSWRHRS